MNGDPLKRRVGSVDLTWRAIFSRERMVSDWIGVLSPEHMARMPIPKTTSQKKVRLIYPIEFSECGV